MRKREQAQFQENTRLLHELLKNQERLHIALKASRACVFEVDIPGQLYTSFENAEDIFGIPGEQILKEVQPFSKLEPPAYQEAVSQYFSHPEDRETIAAAFRSIFSGNPATYEARMKAGKTDFIWCKISVTPILTDGAVTRMVGVITDINEMKHRAELLEEKTKRDSFTGIYNKRYTRECVEKLLEKYPDQRHAMVLIDLDNFKEINDSYGHTVGDEVLYAIAQRVRQACKRPDIVGRIGGDEFLIFACGIQGTEEILGRVKALLKEEDNAYDVTKSIGISLYPEDGQCFESLYRRADQALYHSKSRRNAITLYQELQ